MAGVHLRRLERLFAQYRSKAEGCLKLHFFGLSQRAAWGASRSVGKGSRRLSGRNVLSGYISGRWRDFSQGIDPKLEAVWRECFFGVNLRRLERLFAGYRPKAEGSLELYFFRLSQQVAWGDFSKRIDPKSKAFWSCTFSGYISKGWSGFSQGIDPKPKAVWSCTFSSYRNRPLGEPRGRWEKAAGGGLT